MKILADSGYSHRSRPLSLVHLDPDVGVSIRHLLLDVGTVVSSSLIRDNYYEPDDKLFTNKYTLTKATAVPMLCDKWAYVGYEPGVNEYVWFTSAAPGVHVRRAVSRSDPHVYVVDPLI